ncbi:hypothetical protein B5181_08250 [Streptomyces sp. 4F]|nr:hypothetical protein B5181_08250 [Streptomyces sp. 4F]
MCCGSPGSSGWGSPNGPGPSWGPCCSSGSPPRCSLRPSSPRWRGRPSSGRRQGAGTEPACSRCSPWHLRLGGTHGPLLGALVDRLADVVPDARVTTCTSWSERELAEQLAEGRLDFALAGTCGSAAPPGAAGLVWREVAVDPVFVMVPERHPLARRAEVDLTELADEEWACVPGDGCFGDCFTASCARAGFTPRRMYETDTASLVHLVQVGRAVGLCRATFPTTPGIVTRPLTGTPLAWRHLLGWHTVTGRADTAATVLAQARMAHAGVAASSDSYTEWMAAHRVP